MKTFCMYLMVLLAILPAANAQSTISAGRAIEIRILGVPNEEMARVNSTYPVSESGYVRMPFIGSVRAAGLSPNDLAANIESAYKSAQIYTSPTVHVLASSDETLSEYFVTVGGQVRGDGPVKYSRGMTLYQAVSAAGGATEFGSMKRVKLIRNGKQREYDLEETASKGVLVEPNDTIVVPQKNWLGR